MAGFLSGGTAATAIGTASPFSFGLPQTSTPAFNASGTAGTTAGGSGFSFGLPKTTPSTGLLATPAATSAPGLSNFGFNPTTSATTGFSLGTPSTVAPTATAGFGSFSFGKTSAATTTTTSAPSFGLLGNAPTSTTTASLSLGLGPGLFGTSAAAAPASTAAGIFTSLPQTSAASIFTSLPQTTGTVGLGGLDPNTSVKLGGGSSAGAASDGKTLKESILPEQLTATVDSLQKYVKDEKSVREDITRMSSKPMMKVQEDVLVLRQLLSVVANGLQRNACSVEKLKQEMIQDFRLGDQDGGCVFFTPAGLVPFHEDLFFRSVLKLICGHNIVQKLKNAEMAQRTKDIPASLQYENTAPIEYFQHLVEEFEERMVTYRQQIDTLDNHLTALHQPSPHTPSELLLLLKKLHETFISLAAQLQQVHEAVKAQKDQFLIFRRVFHGDSKNIFPKAGGIPKPIKRTQISDLAGPSPFPGTTNAAAQAMAMVMTRVQQPQGPPITGLVGGAQAGFGGGIFGSGKVAAGFGASSGLPSFGPSVGGVGSLFSSTSLLSSPATGGFGASPSLGSSTTAALNLAGTSFNASPNAKQPFQLQKPPQGAKRGKR